MSTFPPVGVFEDSSKFNMTPEDKGLTSDTDGGYAYSRPRHARKPRRTFDTGFTDIDETQKAKLENFFNEHGTYKIFTYTIPDTEETIQARLGKAPKVMYKGYGGVHRYNVTDIQINEV
ncbi:hypothetical protein JCM19235_1238 [Vibrio maritimus]|uniref:Uncharacterized protein n=1 Tax=Vibrio maritimus TaxID=990268 RepID=A0A090SUD5_9VIBR|nr:hypothetical protein JCM19235_1238 [Vibrio maritimus]